MRVCVCGLWHLGSVTAACLAEHFETIAFDPTDSVVQNLNAGKPPILEPGLEALVRAGLDADRLRFTSDRGMAVSGSDGVWIAYDTPVDDNDIADCDFVEMHVLVMLHY